MTDKKKLGIDIPLEKWKPSFWLTDDVLKHYGKLANEGKIDEAAEFIASYYPRQIAMQHMMVVREILTNAISQELSAREFTSTVSKLGMTVERTQRAIIDGVRLFTTDAIAEAVFKSNGLTNKALQDAILEGTINQFESYVKGAMSGTQPAVLADIRNIQREWILRNQAIRKAKPGDINNLLNTSEFEFKEMLHTKYPRIFQYIKDGKILESRPFLDRDGNTKTIKYSLEEYCEVSIRPTILNIDRNSAEVSSQIRRHRVIEFYKADSRTIRSNERPVCHHVMEKKIRGKSLLAFDPQTADLLGIYTVDKAKSMGAFGIHCRHSIRSVSPEFNEEVNKVIFLKQQSAEEGVQE